MMQSKLVICNDGDAEVPWGAGALIAAFGRGKFGAKSSVEEVKEDTELLYQLQDSNSPVIFNGALTTVGDVYNARLETHPNAEINYHKVVKSDGSGNDFTLQLEHVVVFTPAAKVTITGPEGSTEEGEEGGGDSTGTALQASAANMVPAKTWNTSDTMLAWSVQWRAKGLMPIRPQVVFKRAGALPAGRALTLSAAA